MAQTRRKGLLTGSRNIKTEFYGKVQFVPRSEPRSHAPILSLRAQLRFPQSAGKGRRAAPHTRRPLQVQRCASAPNALPGWKLQSAGRGGGGGAAVCTRRAARGDRCKRELLPAGSSLGALPQLTSARLSVLLSPGTREPGNTPCLTLPALYSHFVRRRLRSIPSKTR